MGRKLVYSLEQAVEANMGYGNYYIVFSQWIPEIYKDMGLQEAKIFMSSEIFEKLRYKHNLSGETMLALKSAIENPVAVIKSNGHLMVVTDLYDFRNVPIIAILGSYNEDRWGNYVASVYGKANIVKFMYSQIVNDDSNLLFLDFDKIEYLRGTDIDNRLDQIKRFVLESRGCKLHMTIERDGEKVELTENEIWAAYSLVSQNLTVEDKELAAEIDNSLPRSPSRGR